MILKSKSMPVLNRREILKALALTVILLSAIWMLNVPSSHASRIIVVPQDYPTIGEAISYASVGDTELLKERNLQ